MSKVKIKTKLSSQTENYEKQLLGTYRGNKLYFLDDKVKVTITLDEIVTMRRVSNEYEIILKFKENEILRGIYDLKKLNYNLPIDIKTNKMYIDSGQFKVDYELSSENVQMDKFLFEINYEVIE
ncbi:MAG: hypothetical protein IJB71_05240 [Bacilli bacterium]|nr:hypothetical protein [Bacilli bacterium]